MAWNSLNASQNPMTTPTIIAIVRYCRSIELFAMLREWWRDVEKSEFANEVKVLPCELVVNAAEAGGPREL